MVEDVEDIQNFIDDLTDAPVTDLDENNQTPVQQDSEEGVQRHNTEVIPISPCIHNDSTVYSDGLQAS